MQFRRRSWNNAEELRNHRKIQTALLRVRLKYIDIIETRSEIAQLYLKSLKNDMIVLSKIRKGASHTWHLFVIECLRRDALQSFLKM